jgi:hypothetical protein
MKKAQSRTCPSVEKPERKRRCDVDVSTTKEVPTQRSLLIAQKITKREAAQDKDGRQPLCVHGVYECVIGQRLLVIVYRRRQSAYWSGKYLPLEEYFEEATNSRLLLWASVDLYDQRSGVASRDLHEWTAGGSWLDGDKKWRLALFD